MDVVMSKEIWADCEKCQEPINLQDLGEIIGTCEQDGSDHYATERTWFCPECQHENTSEVYFVEACECEQDQRDQDTTDFYYGK